MRQQTGVPPVREEGVRCGTRQTGPHTESTPASFIAAAGGHDSVPSLAGLIDEMGPGDVTHVDVHAAGTSPVREEDGRGDSPRGGPVPRQAANLGTATAVGHGGGPNVAGVLDEVDGAAFEGRKTFPGAQSSAAAFEEARKQAHVCSVALARDTSRFHHPPREGVRFESRRLEKDIEQKFPQWSRDLIRLVTAALIVYRRRFGDFLAAELVSLMWLALGRGRVLSVDGRLRYYDPNSGCWRLCTGLFPEGLYVEFRLFMNRLEGSFRTLPSSTRRKQESSLSEVNDLLVGRSVADLRQKEAVLFERWEEASMWNTSRGGPGGGASVFPEDIMDDVPDDTFPPSGPPLGRGSPPGTPLNLDVSMSIRMLGKKLMHELMTGGSVAKNFTQWCSVRITPARGVCYSDRAVRYDHETCVVGLKLVQPLVVMDTMPGPLDYYFFCLDTPLIPTVREEEDTEDEGPERSLEDPVLKAATDDVHVFLSSTFWANWEALQASRAALALAKRGLNGLQCFIFLGAGGCGLSLFTDLLATSLGEELHKYFDPFVFFDDEDSRKCVELLAGGCVLSGQERPQGSKRKLLLHLWRKFLSGEGLRGRLPYAILTRMIRLIGWVRIEVNSLLAFNDLTEDEFESIMRRSAVIKIAARLSDRQYLEANFPSHAEYGIFARDPAFTIEFQTMQYAAAWNRTLHFFERQHGEQQCRGIIVAYTRGGKEGGLTERYMRCACSLEARNTTAAPVGPILAGVAVETDPRRFLIQGAPEESLHERQFAVGILREMCDRGLEAMAPSYFNQCSRKLPGSSRSREELWEMLTRHSCGGPSTSSNRNARPLSSPSSPSSALSGQSSSNRTGPVRRSHSRRRCSSVGCTPSWLRTALL